VGGLVEVVEEGVATAAAAVAEERVETAVMVTLQQQRR
jgi:hypothetical protein